MCNEKKTESSSTPDLRSFDWARQLSALSYAFERPSISASIKACPEDFLVTEIMDVELSGEGEHTWLDISKTRCNTDAVAKSLARFAGVAYRDVAYSGMKDFFAITRQWFSVWRPKGDALNWSEFAMDGVEVHSVTKHYRKIKRGMHRANAFDIRITELAGVDGIDSSEQIKHSLEQRLSLIKAHGVPNYFGAQRFGRNANNMRQANSLLVQGKRIKDRNLRGLILSSARSWLFNACVSARLENQTWQTLWPGEPANLNGSNSIFESTGGNAESQRLSQLDIHPTAPLWGDNPSLKTQTYESLHEFEKAALEPYQAMLSGLEGARLEYKRRAIRCVPEKLEWTFEKTENGELDALHIRFELQSGQFATSVIRELIFEPDSLPQ